MSISQKQIGRWLILILGTFISIVALIYVFKHLVGIELLLRKLNFWGPIFSISLYAILSISPIPSDALNIINGAIYGPIWGSLISWIGNNAAAMIEYYVGKNLSSASGFEQNKSKLPFGLSKLPADSPYLLIFGRMIPQYGGKVISLLAGLYHVPLKRYLWTSAVSNFFGSVIFALGGFGLINLL